MSTQYRVRVSLQDREGRDSVTSIRLSTILQPADTLAAAIALLVPRIAAISDCVPVGVEVTIQDRIAAPDEPGDSLIPYACLIIWRNTYDELATLIIPGLADTIALETIPDTGRVLDLSVFDSLTAALASYGAMDLQNVLINGSVVAAALLI